MFKTGVNSKFDGEIPQEYCYEQDLYRHDDHRWELGGQSSTSHDMHSFARTRLVSLFSFQCRAAPTAISFLKIPSTEPGSRVSRDQNLMAFFAFAAHDNALAAVSPEDAFYILALVMREETALYL